MLCIVVILGVVSLLTDVSSESVIAVLLLFVTAGLGFLLLTYSVLDGIYQGVGTLSRLFGGWLADWWDRPKLVVFGGYALLALTRVGLLAVGGLAALVSLVVLDRIGKGLRTVFRDVLVVLATPFFRFGRAFGVHWALDTVGACFGLLVAFAVLLLLLGRFDAVFVVSLAFVFFGFLVLGLLVPDFRRVDVSGGGFGDFRPFRVFWWDVAFLLVRRLLVGAVVLSALSIGDGLLYLILLERGHVEALWLLLFLLVASVVYFVLAVLMGIVADRWGWVRVFVVGHLVLAVGYFVVVGSGPVLATTGLVLVASGIYYVCIDGVFAAVAGSLAVDGAVASTISLAQTVEALARAGASLMFGVVWTVVGPVPVLGLFCGGLLVVVFLALGLIREVFR